MNAIDRIKEWMDGYIQQREKEYGSAFHKDEKSIEEFYNFLSSLAAERCVWRVVTFHGDDQWQACDDNWLFVKDLPKDTVKGFMLCPYCGKRIEVKEVDNEHD